MRPVPRAQIAPGRAPPRTRCGAEEQPGCALGSTWSQARVRRQVNSLTSTRGPAGRTATDAAGCRVGRSTCLKRTHSCNMTHLLARDRWFIPEHRHRHDDLVARCGPNPPSFVIIPGNTRSSGESAAGADWSSWCHQPFETAAARTGTWYVLRRSHISAPNACGQSHPGQLRIEQRDSH